MILQHALTEAIQSIKILFTPKPRRHYNFIYEDIAFWEREKAFYSRNGFDCSFIDKKLKTLHNELWRRIKREGFKNQNQYDLSAITD